MEITELQPRGVWKYFAEICQIPRPSKKEDKIIAYLIEFAQKHYLEYKKDNIGNVLIKKTATKGMEYVQTIVLQAHMDMVCDKLKDVTHNFETDAIQPYVDGEWVKARGTTLGADDGIGVSAMLAILASSELKHGTIECLFTVDEETGLTGAFAIQSGFFNGKTLINLDSEEEGIFYIGCAGGVDTIAHIPMTFEKCPEKSFSVVLSVKGLLGGHSGGDIHKPRLNAIKLLNRFLWQENQKFPIRLYQYQGGNLRNAIPREASVGIVIDWAYREQIRIDFNIFVCETENYWKEVEPNLQMDLESESVPDEVATCADSSKLLNALYATPHGVFAMSRTIPGMVETSTNLGVLYLTKTEAIVQNLQRSDDEWQKKNIAQMVSAAFQSIGATTEQCEDYPGWKPNNNSQLLKLVKETYETLHHKKPEVCTIHAGLECGLFLEKYPYLDMVSFGPTLMGVHTPDEKIEISTVKSWWKHLLLILENAGKLEA